MSWQDMKTYWAWRGEPLEKEVKGVKTKYIPEPPTTKKLDYVSVGSHKLCIGVWDDEKYTTLHRAELEFYTTFRS